MSAAETASATDAEAAENGDRPLADPTTPDRPQHREAHDFADEPEGHDDLTHHDAKLDIELDETFPSSDPPSHTQPGRGTDPAPSSGFTDGA